MSTEPTSMYSNTDDIRRNAYREMARDLLEELGFDEHLESEIELVVEKLEEARKWSPR